MLAECVGVHAITGSGTTALHRVAQHGHTSAAQLLLENGARVADEDIEGWITLDQAMRRKDVRMVSLFLQHGAKAEACAKYGEKVASWDDDSSHGVPTLRKLLD